MKRARTADDPIATCILSDASWTSLPPEIHTHIMQYLSPALRSTLAETCWDMFYLHYATRRVIRHTVCFRCDDEAHNEFLINTIRDKMQRTPAAQVREIDFRMEGPCAVKYSIGLTDVAPLARTVTIGMPALAENFGFRDLLQLQQIQSLTLHGGASVFAFHTTKLPALRRLTIHASKNNLICNTFKSARTRNKQPRPDTRSLDVTLHTSPSHSRCIETHVVQMFPGARRTLFLHVNESNAPANYIRKIFIGLGHYHRVNIRGTAPYGSRHFLANVSRGDYAKLAEELHVDASLFEEAQSFMKLGVLLLTINSPSPHWMESRIRGTILPHAAHQTAEVRLVNRNRPSDPPITLCVKRDYTILPPRRDVNIPQR